MSNAIDLSKLAEPFAVEDIEWRVSRAGTGSRGIFCFVLAYITARAIEERLDSVCGPANWRNEEPRVIELNGGKESRSAFAVGISIRIDGEWITKWDVSEPTNVEPAKGGFSGAMKRAGQQWGIGRYLYYLEENFAEVQEEQPHGRQWNYAKLKGENGRAYWWKPPQLPAWAIPREAEHKITEADLAALKRDWRAKFAPENKNPAELREGFARFCTSVVGEFPSADFTCWTTDALERCRKRIAETAEPGGVSADVPFDQ